MSASMLQGVLALIFGVIAVCTFLLQGRQWPTFVSAALFGMYIGGTGWGSQVMAWVGDIGVNIVTALS